MLCSAVPLSGPINIADRQYFQQTLQMRDFGTGTYQIGRITGVPSINFGYPVLDEQGQLQAVVFAAVGLDWLNQLVADAQLPEGATFSVIDRQGTVLARIPDSQTWVGKSVPETQIFQAIQRQQGQGTATVPGLDGVTRLYGFSPLGGVPQGSVYASVGIPTAIAYAEADRALARNLAGLGSLPCSRSSRPGPRPTCSC